jgi:hypothetical protein
VSTVAGALEQGRHDRRCGLAITVAVIDKPRRKGTGESAKP